MACLHKSLNKRDDFTFGRLSDYLISIHHTPPGDEWTSKFIPHLNLFPSTGKLIVAAPAQILGLDAAGLITIALVLSTPLQP